MKSIDPSMLKEELVVDLEDLCSSLLHLLGGLVGEGDTHDFGWQSARSNQV
jgi:hypothetical protein